MKKTYTPLLCLLLIILASGASAQCVPFASTELDVNQVRAMYHNGGDMHWDLSSGPRYEVPKGQGAHAAFGTSLWIGGMDGSGQLRMAGQTYRQQGIDYFSGPHSSPGNYSCEKEIEVPQSVLERAMVPLTSGKAFLSYADGYSVYDPVSETTTDYLLPALRQFQTPVELPDGNILLFGDYNYPNRNSTFLIDSAGFQANAHISLGFYHQYSRATVLQNGKVLILGLLGCEIYDPVAGTSDSTIAQPAVGRNRQGLVELSNGKVLAIGGSITSLTVNIPDASSEIYDPAADSWTAGPSLSTARMWPEMIAVGGGDWLIIGGSLNDSTVEVFNENTMQITAGGTLPMAFSYASALELPGGEIAIAGRTRTSTLEMVAYNPTTGTSRIMSGRVPVGGNQGLISLGNGEALVQTATTRFAEWDMAKEMFSWNPFQHVWNVSQQQIDQFIADFANGTVDYANYPDIETWPAHGDVSLGQDRVIAPFIDLNNDGVYQPHLGEYPCIQGDQSLFWVFNDDVTDHTETEGKPLGIQVKASAYAFDCNSTSCPDTVLDYTTFHHFEIVHKGNDALRDVFLGLFHDCDLGQWNDDQIGCDPALNLGYVYNSTIPDGDYGFNPPAAGIKLLSTPQSMGMTNFMTYNNDFSDMGNPELPEHYYQYLQSIWKDGTHLVDNGLDGYDGTAPGADVDYIWPGDPAGCDNGMPTGWSAVGANSAPTDRRYVQGIGPLELNPGDTLVLDFALIWSRAGNNLEAICQLKQDAQVVQNFFDTNPSGCFNLTVDREPTVVPEVQGWDVFPNPNQGEFHLKFEKNLPQDAEMTVLDLAGRVMHVQPLSPGLHDYEIKTEGLAAGVYLVKVEVGEGFSMRKIVVR